MEVMKFLVSIAKCDINTRDLNGNTALHIACIRNADKFFELLLREAKLDANAKNNDGDTPLHLACRSEKHSLVQLLVREAKLDANAKNNDGDTPLHLACRRENFSLVQLLVRDGRCNPNEKNSDGDSALHVVCFQHPSDEISKFLLEEAKIDPNAKNSGKDTPLHLACRSENFKAVQLLVRNERCHPHEKNSNGDTALHVACRLSRTEHISKVLLEEAKLDPNAKNNDRYTPLHVACWRENVKVVQLLVRDERCNPNEKNSNGDTALHIACRHRNAAIGRAIADLLLEYTRIYPDAKNTTGITPLDFASDPDLMRELIRHGANPRDVYKTHGKVLGKHSTKAPLQTPVKLFMVGNPSAGKSTLTKALQSEAFGLKRFTQRILKVSGVDEKTAGIVPHEYESKTYGRVTLYDFAGQREFYGSHAALLQNAIQTSTPIFLIVVDLSKSNDDIKRNVFYWLSFLENQCTSVSSKPHFFVIGSHADILKSRGEDPNHKASFMTSLLTTPRFASLEFTGFVTMDCQYADSAGIRYLHQALKTSCDSLRSQERINFNAHCFLVYLLDKFREGTALTLATIQAQIKEAKASADDIRSFVPSNVHSLYTICDELNDGGHLLVLRNLSAIENSWVIINKTALLTEVNGTLFAPEGFKEHIKLASSTGVVPLSNIAKHFPKHDRYMVVGFISHLEFCSEISDLETLDLISQEQASDAASVQGERYFFFPSLVTLEVPSTVWQPQPQFDYHYGWIMQCSQPDQFFGPRFLQVLLLRLAFSFAFSKLPSTDIPSLQRKCSIWKNGIYWGNGHFIETLVEVADQNRVVVLMRCPKVKSECFQLRSLLIQKVLAAAREFCSKVSTVESFFNPSDTTQYPLKPTAQLAHYSMTGIATAVAKGMPATVDDTGKPVSLDSLLYFEPYADLGEPMLRELFCPHRNTSISEEGISKLALRISRKSQFIQNTFEAILVPFEEQVSLEPASTPLYRVRQVLMIWRDSCEGTYQCLREKLDQFSVFAGRNPLEIAGVSCENSSQATDCSGALTPEIATAMEYTDVDMLAELLSEVAAHWDLFLGQLGLPQHVRDEIRHDNARMAKFSKRCLLEGLHGWVESEDRPTYGRITTALRGSTVRNEALAQRVEQFAERQQTLCDSMPELKPKAFPGHSAVQLVEVAVGECAIHSVVVYQDRAEVKRSLPVHLLAGENELILTNMAECADKNSVRVEGQGKAVITDVIYSSETTSEEQQPASGTQEEYATLKQEIAECVSELETLGFREEVLRKEKELLSQFASHISKTHSVKGEGDSLSKLVDHNTVLSVMEFFSKYEARVSGLDDRLAGLQQDMEKLQERLSVLRAKAEKINPENKVVSSETLRSLHVGLEAAEETDASLLVSYVVANASWSSSYDVRAFTKDKAMKVQYYGLIRQQTGEDWKEASTSLSTAQPSIGGSAPPLPTRLIRFKRPPPRAMNYYARGGKMRNNYDDEYDRLRPLGAQASFGPGEGIGGGLELESVLANTMYSMDRVSAKSGGRKMKPKRTAVRDSKRRSSYSGSDSDEGYTPQVMDVATAKVSAGLFNTTYAIPRATNIPADNTEHKVTVALIDLSPEFSFVSVPRLSPYSYLRAKARNSSPYTILRGPANIFLDNNFIAKSELSDVSPNEDFTTSLGVDQSIRITCQPATTLHSSRSGMLSKTSCVTYTHLFEVKNTHKDSVDIELSEQVPLSTDDRIKVVVTEPDLKKAHMPCPLPTGGHAILNESNNIEWHVAVAGGAKLELRLVYSVEHPPQDGVQGLPKAA